LTGHLRTPRGGLLFKKGFYLGSSPSFIGGSFFGEPCGREWGGFPQKKRNKKPYFRPIFMEKGFNCFLKTPIQARIKGLCVMPPKRLRDLDLCHLKKSQLKKKS